LSGPPQEDLPLHGAQPVRQLLSDAAPVERIVVARGRHGPRLREILDLARQRGIPVRLEERRVLDRLARGGAHQGVLAWVAALPYARRQQVLEGLEAPGLVAVLDGVQDPRNLGAILRTAAATGIQGVFVPERGAVGLTAAVAKAAAGYAGMVPVVREKNLARLLDELKSRGLWVVGLDSGGPPPWKAFDFRQPTALVVGGEGKGLRPLLRRGCDVLVGLPMAAGVESLNVSVALGAVVYEIRRQRSQEA
jgi:23S rRNA (guanosine2251-2'-O)-methyltransferase